MLEKVIILDFGSQFTQLIARRVREIGVYCEIYPYSKIPDYEDSIKGYILSGSHHSVRETDHPSIDLSLLGSGIPVLGICYGAQLMAHNLLGLVEESSHREYGRANLSYINPGSLLLEGLTLDTQVWMSHADTIKQIPVGFETVASSEKVSIAGFENKGRQWYGIQFHPEVTHTLAGKILLQNFLLNICHCKANWTSGAFLTETLHTLKVQLKNDKVVMALSGGVDSTVAAMILHQVIGTNLYCVFVDNGLLRKGEFDTVLESYRNMGLNIRGIEAKNQFLNALEGVADPETKRKIIGRVFIEVFDSVSKEIEGVQWLGQGTIYPDVIESNTLKGPSTTIKSHHNVGGLPSFMKLKLVEPLNTLFKDEVRRVGMEMGISPQILKRHPFPGPGLAVRILGEITDEKIKILQEADSIFIENLKESGYYDKVWQAGCIFLPVRSVGVMGDGRTYENVICLRAVESTDGMTADWSHLPHALLGKISNEIINQVKGINRVVYDISSKPPATIEWE